VLNDDCIANGTIENIGKTLTLGDVVYNIYIFTDCVEFTGFKLRNKKDNGSIETKYYWYAGWTIPTAENIATIVNEANGKAGAYIGTKLGTYDKSNYLAMIDYFDVDKYDYYYVVVPEGIKLYDSEGDASLEDQYSATSIVIPGHRVLKSIEQQFSIGAIMLR
jgi:hypothetical protein